jgi:hypothetical protein
MKRLKNFKIKNAILCEDLRHEINGKHSLMGVFVGDVQVSNLPGPIDLAFYLDGTAIKPEPTSIEVRLSLPSKRRAMIKMNFRTEAPDAAVSLVSPGMMVQLEEEGMIEIAVRDPDGPWKTIISKKVILNPALAIA